MADEDRGLPNARASKRAVASTRSEAPRRAVARDWIEGIDPRLEVLSAAPLVLQTPLDLLSGAQLTEASVLFVRNCQDPPDAMTMAPMPIDDWQLELVGLVRPGPVTIRAADLLGMEQEQLEMVLVCAGNGRTGYAGVPGTPWGSGGIGNVRFGGVALSAILDRWRVEIEPRARFLTAESLKLSDANESRDFEHSLPLADVLERSIIALTLNGEPIPGIHGGPVRLVTPGFYGTMQVKWLRRLRFETTESTSFYHAIEYRVPLERVRPGDGFRFSVANSRPTWAVRLASSILDPRPGSTVDAGDVTISGVAWNDGSAAVGTVVVSTDHGNSWHAAQVEMPESPYAWYRWSLRVSLGPGSHEIWSRAIDALGRTQPLDGSVHWNPNGYEWAGVARTTLTVG